jgi:hypothetical protein
MIRYSQLLCFLCTEKFQISDTCTDLGTQIYHIYASGTISLFQCWVMYLVAHQARLKLQRYLWLKVRIRLVLLEYSDGQLGFNHFILFVFFSQSHWGTCA